MSVSAPSPLRILAALVLASLPGAPAALRVAPVVRHVGGAHSAASAAVAATAHARPGSRRSSASRILMMQQAGAGGGMVDGARIGPPPDMPSLLLSNRIVYLGMPLASSVTELIISELLFLQYESQEKPVIMYINSPGTTTEQGQLVGYETEAFAIADTMDYCAAPIHTVLVGKAYGHAAMLLAAGEKGQRSALPYGTVMLHQPRGMQARGQASDIAIRAREVLLNRQVGLEMMAASTGKPIDQLAADTDRCKYMDAQQALEYGIIDKVVSKSDKKGLVDLEDVSEISRGIG